MGGVIDIVERAIEVDIPGDLARGDVRHEHRGGPAVVGLVPVVVEAPRVDDLDL